MARHAPLSEVNEATTIPEDLYNLHVAQIEETASKTGKLMYEATFRVDDGPFANMAVFERFVIGTDDDPNADNPETWTSPKALGVKRLKKWIMACGVAITDDIDAMLAQCDGQRFCGIVGIETSDGYPDKNQIKKYLGRGAKDSASSNAGDGLPYPSGAREVTTPGSGGPQ